VSTDSEAADQQLQIQQKVTGDRNQVIAHMFGGTAINHVEALNQITQNLPPSLEAARYSLPPDATDFTGREEEIQQIEDDLKAGRVVAIAGMAGVGKSALAVRVAHRLKAEFPGGQIYLNLRGADTQALTVESALESLLRALEVDTTQIPVERADKVALYRSKLAQTQTLVLLDNAADALQVEDLLPGMGVCLITSRRQLDGLAGVKHLNLEALSEDHALKLLQKILSPERVQAEPEAAHDIVGYCGRLPLALRIAAATLGMRSCQGKRLATYAQKLADERQRLDHLRLENLDVRASFELSYRELSPPASQLLGWLGLLPADFGIAVLEPLTQESAVSVQQALAALVDGRLVDPHAPSLEERYILHDLMRLFALEKLKTQTASEVVQAAKVRLVQWYGEQADIWYSALNPQRRQQLAEALATEWAKEEAENALGLAVTLAPRLLQIALNRFEVERQTLLQVFDWASETQQGQTSIALATNLAPFFELLGYWQDSVSTHQQVLTVAHQTGDRSGEGQSLKNLGGVYHLQGKWAEASDCYQQSLQIARAIGDVHWEGTVLNNLGTVYQSQSRWNEAIACFEQASQITQTTGDAYSKGRILNNLGNVYQPQGKWNEAIDCYQQSLQIFQELGDVNGESATLNNLGIVYRLQGKWNEAIDVYHQSLQIYQMTGDVRGEGQSFNNLGNVYMLQGKWDKAIDSYEQDLQICHRIGDIYGQGATLNNLGNVYMFQGKWNKAIDAYHQSLQIRQAIGDSYGEGQTLGNLGLVHQSQGKWGEAIACYEKSLQIKRAIGDSHGEGQTLANLGNVYKRQKRLGQANTLWEEALTKLHPNSPDHATVTQWLRAVSQPRHHSWIGWLLSLGILLLLIWNLISGHWLIALLGALALIGWLRFRKRR
jgi:tetratricopeptide (TPR) repeat protein